MDNVERRFYRYHEPPGGYFSLRFRPAKLAWFIAYVLLFTVGAATHSIFSWPFFAALAPLLVFVRAARRNSLCAGFRVEERGLRACYPLGFGRLYRWDEMEGVVIDEDGATIRTSRGSVRLRGDLSDWLRVAGLCQRALGQTVSRELDHDAVVDLPAEEVASWLGVSLDGSLRCTSLYHRRFYAYQLGSTLVYLLGLYLWNLGLLAASVIGMLLTGYNRASRKRGARISEVRASPTDLDVRSDTGWHKYPWGGLLRLVPRGRFWVVSTVDGDLWLPPGLKHGKTLLAAIRQAIEARQRGFALPRMSADVSQAALSRAEAGAMDAERGLSVAEEGAER
jgi:hypothetical protein